MKRFMAVILLLLTVVRCPLWRRCKVSRVRVGENVMQALLVKRVDPQQPSGDAAHIRREVVFKALIGKDGSIESLQAVSGHPMLIPAAIEAVKQWKYKP